MIPLASPGAATAPSPPPASPSPSPALDPVDLALAQALARQQALDATKSALSTEIAAAAQAQTQLGLLIDANRAAIKATEQRIAAEEQALHEASIRAAQAHADADASRHEAAVDRAVLAGAVRSQYEHDDGFLTYLIGSGDISDFLTRLLNAEQLNGVVGTLEAKLAAAEQRARDKEAEAHGQETIARQMAADLAQQQADLRAQIDQEQQLIGQLGAQAGAANDELRQVDNQTAALAQEIADLRIQQLDETIARAEQAAWDEAQYYLQHNLSGLPPGQYTFTASDLNGSKGQLPPGSASTRLAWPVPGSSLVPRFGPSPYPFEPSAFGYPHFHTGLDLAAPLGRQVLAATDGIVASATAGSTGYGNHIVIAADGQLLTLYGHLEAMLVHAGDHVTQGQVIGLLGSTGNSTGPHLHFEARIVQVPVDPLPLLPTMASGQITLAT